MNLDTTRKAATLAVGLALAAGMAGCRVHVDKDANGQDKKVQVDTPFGGVHVNTDQTTAADLGLPVYPGATVVKDNDNHKSADVHLGFGEWELRVRTVSYETGDRGEGDRLLQEGAGPLRGRDYLPRQFAGGQAHNHLRGIKLRR
jgi:hypothetical protein